MDRAQLQAMASYGAWYFEAADADDLEAIYEAIAVELPCSRGTCWGWR